MHDYNIIDVDFKDIDDTTNKKDNDSFDIDIAFDPVSQGIKEFSNIVNTVTTSIKEYSMCKQMEVTKRAKIKADTKIALEQINAQKQVIIEQLKIGKQAMDYKHEENMKQLQDTYNTVMIQLDMINKALDSAIEIATSKGDMESLIGFMESQSEIFKFYAELQIKSFAQISNNSPNLDISNRNVGYLE